MKKFYTFDDKNLIKLNNITFDVISQQFGFQFDVLKVFKYTRRAERQYSISKQLLFLDVSPFTPHINSIIQNYKNKNNKDIEPEEICKILEDKCKDYLLYGLQARNENWVRLSRGNFEYYKNNLTLDECLEILGISEKEFSENLKINSPY